MYPPPAAGIHSNFPMRGYCFLGGCTIMTEKISRKNWVLIWVLGMAGQICWNIENSWFNTFVYRKIAPDPAIVAWMVGVSAVVSTFCTFLIGTAGDRIGKRRPFIAWGYILWGMFTIAFGVTEFLPKNPLWLAATCVVLADAIMTLQSLDCWYMRLSHDPVDTPIQQFYDHEFGDTYMADRFQSMTIHPSDAVRGK